MGMGTPARIAVTLIDPPTHMLRDEIDPLKLGELADSMAAEGLHQAIGVRGPSDAGRFEIVWGHRRWAAARSLQWDEIDARVYPMSFDPLLAAISENLQREQLTPLEEAKAIEKMRAAGHPLQGIARLFRRSDVWVRARLDLLGTPPDVQEAVAAGALPLAVAYELASIEHAEYRRSLIEEAKRTGATLATVRVWVAHYEADRARIETNHDNVAEIVSRREAFVIYTACDGCRKDVDFRTTRALRFCSGCADELQAAFRGEQSPGDLASSGPNGGTHPGRS
jgi:ParB/RepB/Spo0J family partition protein